ncbi:ABC transporter permease [Humitalea sp. 24SJ18S-53]|uniref:ABC transporter permease n=1 Tax=Humitalea sp. 24SJ18S-53 TaxID=3422307 RepID=UPI003D674DFC
MRRSKPWRMAGAAFAIVFSIFMLAPMVVVLGASFTAEGYIQFPPASLGLRWYREAFANESFVNALYLSLRIATATAVLSGLLGVAAAIALTDVRMPGRQALVGLATLPLALPHIVLAIALLQLFGMIRVATAPYALLAGHVLTTLPYVLRLTMNSLAGLDPKLELASQSLGASRIQTLRRIVVPLGARGILAGILFSFLLSFDEVTIALFTATPGQMTLPAEIFSYASQGADPVIAAASGIMIMISAVLVLVIERCFGVLRLIIGDSRKAS